MRALLGTHRHLSLLVAVLLIQLFLLAYQIKGKNDVRLIRLWAVAVIGPVEKGVNLVVDAATTVFRNYIALHDARQENERLQAELDQARLRLQALEARAAQADQLAALLAFKQSRAWAPLLAAQVIGASPAATARTVLIDRGREDGLQVNMAVLTPDGVVGKVVDVFPATAQVLLITDRKSGVGVQVAGSQLLGVLNGTGTSLCRLEYIPPEETVAVGAELLTSGQDQLFPKGVPVGRVSSVSVRPGEPFQEIMVQPAARLSRLEHVLVLAGPPEALTTTASANEGPGRLAR